jgi:hypothetical protein
MVNFNTDSLESITAQIDSMNALKNAKAQVL